ncbi:MAG: hypothetical protein DRP02_12355 [Candidatus Gerdarchaeota archaeon]|nr:MAG: hypothetical protein DRP02_12355 [Candidatus Gerdarchaeota archaeon]
MKWKTIGFLSWTRSKRFIKLKLKEPTVKTYIIDPLSLQRLLDGKTVFINTQTPLIHKGKTMWKRRGYLAWSKSRQTLIHKDGERVVCIDPNEARALLNHKVPYVKLKTAS